MPKWWNKKYGRESICGITRSRLRPGTNKHGQTYSVFLSCKHGYCRSALKQWVLTNPGRTPTCPLCRAEFNPLKAFI